MEYFIVLFGIRYDKHWRRAKPKPSSSITTHNSTTTATGASATTNLSQASENDVKTQILITFFIFQMTKKRRNEILFENLEKTSIRACGSCLFSNE